MLFCRFSNTGKATALREQVRQLGVEKKTGLLKRIVTSPVAAAKYVGKHPVKGILIGAGVAGTTAAAVAARRKIKNNPHDYSQGIED